MSGSSPISSSPPLSTFSQGGAFHLVGVGGVGMSALAQALLDAGASVSGSDRLLDAGAPPPIFDTLRAAGVRLAPQDGSGVVRDLAAVIVSTAVESGNADLEAAGKAGVPVLHRAEVLARLVAARRLIAVAGTAGKTTVTAMLGFLLEQLGADPLVVNGGVLADWDRPERVGSVRAGGGEWAVIEADESDRSLLCFSPAWTLLTNISTDHFELGEVERIFGEFAARTREGWVTTASVAETLRSSARRAPVLADAAEAVQTGPDGVRFVWRGIPTRLCMPGRHNAENAALALSACVALGFDAGAAVAALGRFSGVRRRLEIVGAFRGAIVVDDYAHNPAKIAASWDAVAAGGGRVLGVWRPHGFGPLSLMFDELAKTFARRAVREHRLYLLPVYYAGGTARGTRTSDELAAAIRARAGNVEIAADYDALETAIAAEARAGDTILVMGARDPGLSAFCRRLAKSAPG